MVELRRNLSVEIQVLGSNDAHPVRKFVLKGPTYAIRVGRGSKSGNPELWPADDNAWFDSRVMSREHAVLKADPDTRRVYVQDVGSMHGTHLETAKIAAYERYRVFSGTSIMFGSEVTRGPDSFLPLRVSLKLSWMDESAEKPSPSPASHLEPSTNTFQVPETDADQADDGQEISFVQETVLAPKLEPIVPAPACLQREPISPSAKVTGSTAQRGSVVDLTSSSTDVLPRNALASTRHHLQHDQATSASSHDRRNARIANDETEGQVDLPVQKMIASAPFSEPTSPSPGVNVPATSHITPPISSPSGSSQIHIGPRHITSAMEEQQVTEIQKTMAVLDEDLTQSEPNSEKPSTSALVVDDSEGEQDRSRSDSFSDYYQKALLTESHGPKLSLEEDWSDSENVDSVFEQESDNEHKGGPASCSQVSMSGPKYSHLVNGFSEGQDWSTEQEQVAHEVHHGELSASCSGQNLPSHALNRAPSPSDAAMAKPREIVSGLPDTQTGLSQDSFTNSPTWVIPMPSTYQSNWQYDYSIADRQHAPYDGRSNGLSVQYSTMLPPTQYAPETFQTLSPSGPMAVNQITNLEQNSLAQFDQQNSNAFSERQRHLQTQSARVSDAIEVPTETLSPLETGVSSAAAKVSINSIVENIPPPTAAPSTGSDIKPKRKADDMEADTGAARTQQATQSSCPEENQQSLTGSRPVHTIPVPRITRTRKSPAATDVVEARPAKRARTSRENKGSSFATLAATAVAGAVVGGVGVVAALVSLPQDFFV